MYNYSRDIESLQEKYNDDNDNEGDDEDATVMEHMVEAAADLLCGSSIGITLVCIVVTTYFMIICDPRFY